MSAEDRAAFFADDMVPPSDPDALWVPCSQGSTIFDLSKNMQHALVESLASTAWEGKQSITTYLANGFHKIYQFPKESSDFIIVPFDVDGKPIPHSEYGSLQVVAKHVSKDGHNLFDCYIDMNPQSVDIGFLTKFWDKAQLSIWTGLDGQYVKENPYLWHVSELNIVEPCEQGTQSASGSEGGTISSAKNAALSSADITPVFVPIIATLPSDNMF